jgi:ribonuclease I
MRDNPALPPAGIAVLCSGRYLKEVRVCLEPLPPSAHLRPRDPVALPRRRK